LDSRPSSRAAINACQRFRNIEPVERGYNAECLAFAFEHTAVEQHAHGLDRVEGDPVRALANLRAHLVGQSRHEPVEQRVHRVGLQRLEHERRRAAAVGTEIAAAFEQLRAREREHEDRPDARPLQQMVDEVEECGVRPVQILEDERDGGRVAHPLEEETPGGEQILALDLRTLAETQQMSQQGLDPLPLAVDPECAARRRRRAS